MSVGEGSLSPAFFFNDAWSQERLHCYAFVVEGKKKKPNISIAYSKHHKAYECPTCGTFHDKNIDTVTRHTLHCKQERTVREYRGWWLPGAK